MAAFFLVIAAATAAAQEDGRDTLDEDPAPQVRIETVPVAGNIYMLEGRGGNIGVSVGADGIFMVDDQFAMLTEPIREALAALSDAPVRFVINTHIHPDHTGGNENLGKAGALVIAHDKAYERLKSGQFIEFIDRYFPPVSGNALPVLTYSEEMTFHFNGDVVKVIHLDPAHTDTDSIVHFTEANVIHMGDAYRTTSYPVFDLGNGGRLTGLIAAADRALPLADEDTRIIPGHGEITGREGLRAWRDMMVTVRDRVKAHIEEGKNLGEIIAEKPTADFDAQWDSERLPAERFVWYVYQELARETAR